VPLAEHLERAGALAPEDRRAIEPLIAAHVRRHGNDPQKSLASLSSADRLKRDLAGIDDSELEHSLAFVGTARKGNEDVDSDLT
jgi:hypothetical protein